MKSLLSIALVLVVTVAAATAAPMLTYTASGDDTIVTAADGATTYWEMVVDTSSARPGRIMSFIDKSGASDDTFNYAFDYNFGSGMLDGMDNGEMRSAGKWTVSDLVLTATEMSYRISREATRDAGTAIYCMDYTIGLPTITAAGYDTNINVVDTFLFDADWAGANGDARIRAMMRLAGSDDMDEWTVVTHNGVADGGAANLMVEATATAADAAMAAGSTFTETLSYTLFDGAYAKASAAYSTWAGAHFDAITDLGVTGSWAGNPGAAGSPRCFTGEVDLGISIVPEPATMSLVGLGALALLRRRK